MYDHEIAWCKKVIASGAKGDDLKSAQERLKKAEAGRKEMLKKIEEQENLETVAAPHDGDEIF